MGATWQGRVPCWILYISVLLIIFLAGCGGQTKVARGNWRGANWEVVRPTPPTTHYPNAGPAVGGEVEALKAQVKNQLEQELLQEHDYKTLRLLIVNAEYDEIIKTLREHPSLNKDFE